MACKSCQSVNQRRFFGELAIHYPGLGGLDKPIVWVFPKLVVCVDCGVTEFTIQKPELSRLVKEDGTETIESGV